MLTRDNAMHYNDGQSNKLEQQNNRTFNLRPALVFCCIMYVQTLSRTVVTKLQEKYTSDFVIELYRHCGHCEPI